jgi:hypothetical protein
MRSVPTGSASGNPTLGMLVEMLVEGVFLVSGVVKTVLWSVKKKREFFCFSPRTKGSNVELRGNFQIGSFPYRNAENMFYNFVVLFFLSVKNRREKFLCTSRELVLHFFFPLETAGEISRHVNENLFCIFFLSVRNSGRKFYACHQNVLFFF